jgi:hypothetical protein
VWIGKAHDLPGVAWIGENFLVASEAGIKNDFSATTGFGARRAAVKNSPVFEREYRATCERLRQCGLLKKSC